METQTWEEMQALEEGRPAALKSLATLELQLPVEWVEHPPDRLDMCNACARLVEQVVEWVDGRAGARARRRAGGRRSTAAAGRLQGGAGQRRE
jgi:hypothetical protein